MDEALYELAVATGRWLQRRSARLVTAESCTGGWIAKVMTDVAGSSAWFERGFVTYSNEAKQSMLGVRAATLERVGAVSEAVVREMATGALTHSRAQWAVAVSGVAGPEGGSADKPVGTVWIAWASSEGGGWARRFRLAGDREAVRRSSVQAALAGLIGRDDDGG